MSKPDHAKSELEAAKQAILDSQKAANPSLGDLIDALGIPDAKAQREAVKDALASMASNPGSRYSDIPGDTWSAYMDEARAIYGCKGAADAVDKKVQAARRAQSRADALVGNEEAAKDMILVTAGSNNIYVRDPKRSHYFLSTRDTLAKDVLARHPWVPMDAFEGSKGSVAQALINAYGKTLHSIEYDTSRSESRVVHLPTTNQNVLLTPTTRPTPTEAVWSDTVDEWLQHLAGPKYDKLCDWIAVSHRLELPCAALYLQGRGGIGKSLFEDIMAAPFDGVRCTYDSLLRGEFQEGLMKSPMVILSEGSGLSNGSTSQFRELISNRSREVNIKYRSPATVKGCIRLIITANNANALRIRELLTKEDEEAIQDRIFHIDCDPHNALQAFFQSIDTTDWATPHGEATKHFQWLRENVVVTPGPRFLVTGDRDSWASRAAQRSGPVQEVLLAIAKAVCMSSRLSDGSAEMLNVLQYRPDLGTTYVSSRGLYANWRTITKEDPDFKQVEVLRVLKAIREGTGLVAYKSLKDKKAKKGHAIPVEQVIQTAVEFELEGADEVEAEYEALKAQNGL